jgi:uncharacterized protein
LLSATLMITDPFFYLCAIPAILIFGMAKGGFGGGIAVLSVPLISLAISPVQAAAIMLPLLLVMDAVALWSFKGNWHRQNLSIMLPAAVVGIIIGAFGFRYLSEDAIRVMIGVISLTFCANSLLKQDKQTTRQPHRLKGSLWGMVAGFTSFGIHAGGPPASIYLLPQKMEKTLLMGTMAVFFAAINLVKLVPYTWLGQLDSRNLMTALVLMPLAPIGVRVGYFLLNKVEQKRIYQLCYFFLAVVGTKLLVEGINGLISQSG